MANNPNEVYFKCHDFRANREQFIKYYDEHKEELATLFIKSVGFVSCKVYIHHQSGTINIKSNESHLSFVEHDVVSYLLPMKEGRFNKPEDTKLIDLAILFNDGRLDENELSNMVALAEFVIDRLHENGDVTIKCSKEE